MLEIVYIVVSLLLGFATGVVLVNKFKQNEINLLLSQLENERSNLNQSLSKLNQLNLDYGILQNENLNLNSKLSEHKLQLNELQKTFSDQFENLANRIFEEKVAKFETQNNKQLTTILDPLAEKIKAFEKKVEEVYYLEGKERASLKEQIIQLSELNNQMNREAQNLTQALKGDNKLQGNWGEMIMESILEKSGLVRDREYFLQENLKDDYGQNYRLDALVMLPQNKALIIDSKVSLKAYERFINDGASSESAKNEHLTSLKMHIKNLASKNYTNLNGINTPDFVLLFIPIESAFALALKEDSLIFEEAISRNIILVCPSTLLATMKTVASIWRNERSSQNADAIAKLGGEIFDKIVGIIDSMDILENAIKSSQSKFDLVKTRLIGGRGIIKNAQKLKDLGAKTSKVLEHKYQEADYEE